MKKWFVLLIVIMLTLTACQQADNTENMLSGDGTQITDPVTIPEGEGSTDEPEIQQESEVPRYPWLAPEVESMGYEEFFAEERAYHAPDAPWYGYTRGKGSFWIFEDGESYTAYELESDENGFFICKNRDEENPIHRIPNTEDLVNSQKVITNTRWLYCIQDGALLRVDVLTGQADTLYTAEHIPDMVLGHTDVLYFLAISDGILCLNRLYTPTMTLDLLYAQTAPEVPASCYELYLPNTNRSVVKWETINPAVWKKIAEILAGPESEYPELLYPSAFTLEHIAEHPFSDEAVQHNFARLQDVLNLRPRMKGYYDPTADTYEEKYGIYDICFFGTGIHSDEEHFESYQEYRRAEE